MAASATQTVINNDYKVFYDSIKRLCTKDFGTEKFKEKTFN
jgi:hypothetical protein